MSEVAAAAVTAGMLLRRAREAAGLHVAALAVALKVPVRKLEALEADRHDQLPDAVFARALASSVCRSLKVDARPILALLPQTSAPRLVHDREGLNEPFRAPGDPAAPGWFDQLTRPVFLVVYALLLGALVIVLLPGLRRDEPAGATATSKPEPVAAPRGMTTPALAPLPVVTEPAAPHSVAPSDAATASLTATSASVAPVGLATAAGAMATPAPTTTGIVVFRATGPSWVEVVDSQGNVALRRLMAAGETAGATGPTPLAITVGSANVTTVEVRGKPYPLAPAVLRDNVARFDIK